MTVIGPAEIDGGTVVVALYDFLFSSLISSMPTTHFSVMAAVEVLGKLLVGLVSSRLTGWVGFESTFALAAALSVLPIALCSLSVGANNKEAHKAMAPVRGAQWVEF